jgi:hypothetical protein
MNCIFGLFDILGFKSFCENCDPKNSKVVSKNCFSLPLIVQKKFLNPNGFHESAQGCAASNVGVKKLNTVVLKSSRVIFASIFQLKNLLEALAQKLPAILRD